MRDQATRVIDVKLGQETERFYNSLGELETEKLGNGLKLEYAYDQASRICQVRLPDQTGIEYVYDAVYLKEIHRLVNNKRTYAHIDQKHSLSGQIIQSKPPGNHDEVHYGYDLVGRCTKISSKPFNQHIPNEGFDAAGNLRQFVIQDTAYTFTYDDLYQLTSEKGHEAHTYASDSLSNRITKDGEVHVHNALHQLLQKGKERFTYDLNGSLIQRNCEGKTITYNYDALDRLIEVTQEGVRTTYIYDPFNRRIAKKQEGKEEQLFIYQGQEEIGVWSEGALQELRLLGKNKLSGGVALELKGELYIPLHDLSGNIVCLSNAKGQVVERYRYTAFGENEILDPEGGMRQASLVGNAWQYAGKRRDSETGLIAFGLRYYEPGIGRWITPDPAGFEDGLNLYAYVHNSPLLYSDQFGLFSFALTTPSFDYHFGLPPPPSSNTPFIPHDSPTIEHQSIEPGLEAEHNIKSILFRDITLPDFERTATYSLNDGMINPKTGMPFQLKEVPHKGIGFVNGILNRYNDFEDSMCHLGRLSENNIKGIHSPSFGPVIDYKCYRNALCKNIAYEPVREIHKMWYDFFKDNPCDATFLMICHSRGVVYVRNALMDFSEELRKRIEVIAIAPGDTLILLCVRVLSIL